MRGTAEHKVPGGKLLRADVKYGETIEAVELHGDFFIEPEEVRYMIQDALQGASRDAGDIELVRRIQDAVPTDAQLIGFSPEDVVTVVTEAMQDAE